MLKYSKWYPRGHQHTKFPRSMSAHSAVRFQSVALRCKLVTMTTLRPRLGLSQESLNHRWGTHDAVDAFILWPHPGNLVPLDGINLLVNWSRVLKGWLTYQISGSIRQQVLKLTSRKWCNKVYRKRTKLGSTFFPATPSTTRVYNRVAMGVAKTRSSNTKVVVVIPALTVESRLSDPYTWRFPAFLWLGR